MNVVSEEVLLLDPRKGLNYFACEMACATN